LARFDEAWEKEKATAAAAAVAGGGGGGKSGGGHGGRGSGGEKPKKPSIVRAFFSTFWGVVWRTGVVEIITKCGQLAVPVIVQRLLRW
jgi:hypothetical protein